MGARGKIIHILGRCGEEEAVYVCSECIYEGDGWLCEDCPEDHECGEYARMSVEYHWYGNGERECCAVHYDLYPIDSAINGTAF